MDSLDSLIIRIRTLCGWDYSRQGEVISMISGIAAEYPCRSATEKVAELICGGLLAGMSLDDSLDYAREGMRLEMALLLMGATN